MEDDEHILKVICGKGGDKTERFIGKEVRDDLNGSEKISKVVGKW